jgi:hypothetical protein
LRLHNFWHYLLALQEALDKIQALKNSKVCWHFIGPIQSNKTKQIAQNFDWVHSVDTAQLLSIYRSCDIQDAEILSGLLAQPVVRIVAANIINKIFLFNANHKIVGLNT